MNNRNELIGDEFKTELLLFKIKVCNYMQKFGPINICQLMYKRILFGILKF